MSACPSQAAACDASPGCQTLRSCSLACQSDDIACRNACTAKAASDTTAIVAGANYLACADTSCASQCSGSSAGAGGAGAGPGGSSGAGGGGGAGGTGGSTGPCATTTAKLTSCGVTPDFTCSDTDPLASCNNTCNMNYSCSLISAYLNGGADNAFGDCLTTCEVTVETNDTFNVAAGGYVTAGAWKGYAFTATDGVSATTISPANFSAVAAGGQLCVSGTVAGTADYSGVAILGININQAQGSPAPSPSTWSPSGNEITYGVTNAGGSPLRSSFRRPAATPMRRSGGAYP